MSTTREFRVYITGNLDWDYELEAETEHDAEQMARDLFAKEFSDVMWSGIEMFDIEEINNES